MTQWYVKDLSNLTGVSKQTLHHYDQIGLLKPSLRLTNGYRLYSEADLLKLQQIIALKFFGFALKDIKTVLAGRVDPWDHFLKQAECLEEQAKNLMEASQALKRITAEKSSNKSIPWKTILELIEVYKMTQTLEKTWAGKVFDSQELKDYASFEASLKERFTLEDKKDFKASIRTNFQRCTVFF
jgi:DNA-binding transcriptional MerR regulator